MKIKEKILILTKGIVVVALAFFALSSFVACSNELSDASSNSNNARVAVPNDVPENTLRVYFKIPDGVQASDIDFWLWGDDVKTPCNTTWTAKAFVPQYVDETDRFVVGDIELKSTLPGKPASGATATPGVRFIPRKSCSDAGKLTGDIIFKYAKKYNVIYAHAGDEKVYRDKNFAVEAAGIAVSMNSINELVITGFDNTSLATSNVTVKDKSGTSVTVSKLTLGADNKSATVTLSDGGFKKLPYTVTVVDTSETVTKKVEITADVIDAALDIDSIDVSELGATGSASSMTFKTWAPTASKVQLLLFSDALSAKVGIATGDNVQDMTEADNGIWKIENVDTTGKKYYKYSITTTLGENKIADIWSKAASADSVASQIVDINTDSNAKPSGWETTYKNPFKGNDYSDAIIYEMHIRDWGGGTAVASFEDLASNENIAHLKDLGITHVQILPMFDYAQTNSDTSYNWGYNPYHYNVPEGRYTKNMVDGTDAVKQMRAMIQKLHDNGIAVIMDVVYNHTNGTGKGSLYDMTVPTYFYRLDDAGSYKNGSGCGNETATNHKMFKKYVIASLEHWMKDYHINGFRFDLMGIHEPETMKEIYDALYKIDNKVMVYGEPWGGDGFTSGAGVGTSGHGYGAFDDDFRDGIKGGEFGGFHRGIVNGNLSDDRLLQGLLGKSGSNNRNTTSKPGLAIHYAECHDNYTLFDKLLYSKNPQIKDKFNGENFVPYFAPLYNSLSTYIDDIKKEDKLSAAFIFLAQGTPFINGGQEFMRTKQGNPDSYSADTKGGHAWTESEIKKCNTIDWSLKQKYADVYSVYKGLIALRKDNPTVFGHNASATAAQYASTAGVIKYLPAGSSGDFVVFFNATSSDVDINASDKSGFTKSINVEVEKPLKNSGANFLFSQTYSASVEPYTENNSLPDKIPAKGFVILKK